MHECPVYKDTKVPRKQVFHCEFNPADERVKQRSVLRRKQMKCSGDPVMGRRRSPMTKQRKYINQYIKKSYTNSVEFDYVKMRTKDFMIRPTIPRN